ncbi:MAG: DegT/DnrJ/EryC1/StrS family aminotransferase [Rhodocyclaceae bacterium]
MIDRIVRQIPWFGPELGEPEKQLVLEAIDSNYINDGHLTRRFEREIAQLVGRKHAVAVTSGTAAISLALMGLGIGREDEVIVPDLTFIATANAVVMAGATPRLVDIDPARFCLDPECVNEAIGPRTRAIIPVDVNGRGADYHALQAIAEEHGLYLVTDSAEAFGSSWRGKPLGSFGIAGCFSFSANKTVTTGQGGMIVTDDDGLHQRLLELKDQGRSQQGTGGDDLHPVIGFNFKLTNLQAAIGLAQLGRLDIRLAQARIREHWYRSMLNDMTHISFPPWNEQGGEVLQWTDAIVEKRDNLKEKLSKGHISTRSFWHPLHRQAPYALQDAGFSNAIRVSATGLWLPSAFSLTQADAAYVAETIHASV